jgi:hypothetical protein
MMLEDERCERLLPGPARGDFQVWILCKRKVSTRHGATHRTLARTPTRTHRASGMHDLDIVSMFYLPILFDRRPPIASELHLSLSKASRGL